MKSRKTHRERSLRNLGDKRDVRILGLILNAGRPLRTGEITDREKELEMSHQTIMNRLYFLEREGWVVNRKNVEGKRRISVWELTPKAYEALGANFENASLSPIQTLEEKLSDSTLKTEEKQGLIASFFRDFQLILGASAMASIRHAIYMESYPKALEQWRWLFTLLVEQQSQALLRVLHKHRLLVLKAIPSVKKQAQKMGILPGKGEKNV